MSEHEPEYQLALDWLFTRTRGGGVRTPGRAAALLERLGLGAPDLTVSVVGTNGKGTVASMIAGGLTAAGHSTGRFTSPHVESFLERIAVDGALLSESAVVEFVGRAKELAPAPEGLAPAFFEWALALALEEFKRQGVTAAVLEAGVGGGSDATRAVENVCLTVITNVDLDHTETLGPTLEQIAADKVGAIRYGQPVVSGVIQEGPRKVVRAEAERLAAPLHEYLPGQAGQALFSLPAFLAPALRAHPAREMNSRLASAALRLLGADEAAVTAGLRTAALPARGERFVIGARGPAPRAPRGLEASSSTDKRLAVEVLLDGAHDPAAARQLIEEIGGRPFTLLFGALGRKQGAAVLAVLAEHACSVVLTEAQEGDGMIEGWESAVFVRDPEAALNSAAGMTAERAAHSASRPLLVVAGSLYLAGRIRPLLRSRGQRLPAAWEAQSPDRHAAT